MRVKKAAKIVSRSATPIHFVVLLTSHSARILVNFPGTTRQTRQVSKFQRHQKSRYKTFETPSILLKVL